MREAVSSPPSTTTASSGSRRSGRHRLSPRAAATAQLPSSLDGPRAMQRGCGRGSGGGAVVAVAADVVDVFFIYSEFFCGVLV